MGNVQHPRCTIRVLASEAKSRLKQNGYAEARSPLAPPRDVSPAQKQMYMKLKELLERGEEIVNPIEQLADKRLLDTLSHAERQRYILQLTSDYLDMRGELSRRLASDVRTD